MRGEPKCKMCRRAGERLFIKAERCSSPKCAAVRKPYPPGMHGKSRRRGASQYGIQLRDKQKVRYVYNLSESQLRRYVTNASQKKGSAPQFILQMLERRLDNVLFRLGMAKSRLIARQVVGHGHIFVNGRKVNIPSYQVKVGDRITIKPTSTELAFFRHLAKEGADGQAPALPACLSWDPQKKEGVVTALPVLDTADFMYNVQNIIEFYSR